mmetsp:Transcript_2500/g.5861  ORF Transcript_2500/g.5861 Transcript_2500/m.5861 type:complete len:229 (+) Transcript_2500:672-1358(+)
MATHAHQADVVGPAAFAGVDDAPDLFHLVARLEQSAVCQRDVGHELGARPGSFRAGGGGRQRGWRSRHGRLRQRGHRGRNCGLRRGLRCGLRLNQLRLTAVLAQVKVAQTAPHKLAPVREVLGARVALERRGGGELGHLVPLRTAHAALGARGRLGRALGRRTRRGLRPAAEEAQAAQGGSRPAALELNAHVARRFGQRADLEERAVLFFERAGLLAARAQVKVERDA